MSSATPDSDARESQVLFLNYHNPPNDPYACNISSSTIEPTLGMLGLTRGFVESLSMTEKKAIVFLASYAVDWRECGQEYDDIVFCFSRASPWEKSVLSGLVGIHCGALEYAKHIYAKRIEPNIDQLRQSSYRLNCGISAVAPRGVAVAQAAEPSKTTAAATTPLTKTSPSSRQTLPAPTIASGSDVRGAAIVASNTPPYSAQVLFPPKILGFGSSFSSSTSRTYSMNIPLKGGVSADVDMAAPPDQSQSNQTSAVAASSTNLTGQQGLDVMDVEPSQQAGDDTVNVAGSSGTQQDVEMKEETGQTTEAEVNTGENAEVYNDTATDTERPNKRRKVE